MKLPWLALMPDPTLPEVRAAAAGSSILAASRGGQRFVHATPHGNIASLRCELGWTRGVSQ
jgi:hypothetical protein